MATVVKTRDLSKILQGRIVVDELNITIGEGQIYGLLGPNGSGKTTVMKMILNLILPSLGSIELFGQPLEPGSYYQFQRISSMIERPIFYRQLSAYENLVIHCEYLGCKPASWVNDALSFAGLSLHKDVPVGKYSLGMQQRLGVARAMIANPELIILDEPLNSLDLDGMQEIRNMIIRLNRERGTTVLVSSHMLDEMEGMLDALAIMKDGTLLAELSAEEFHSHRLKDIYRGITRGGDFPA